MPMASLLTSAARQRERRPADDAAAATSEGESPAPAAARCKLGIDPGNREACVRDESYAARMRRGGRMVKSLPGPIPLPPDLGPADPGEASNEAMFAHAHETLRRTPAKNAALSAWDVRAERPALSVPAALGAADSAGGFGPATRGRALARTPDIIARQIA
jgi:hypothetical protein